MTTGLASDRYQLGSYIDLADLLAIPPDGNRYSRDEAGRLILMSPDDARFHGFPLCILAPLLRGLLTRPYRVLHERSIAFSHIYNLRGKLLRESFLGPKTLAPDVACFGRKPGYVRTPRGGTDFAPDGVLLVVEILSRDTWRQDLGLGRADKVDKMRSYLESGVPEYWLLNPAVRHSSCTIPPRGGLFLARNAQGTGWEEIRSEKEIVRSRAIPGLAFDLAAYWRECEED
ncbi:MAG: Uma2 family endonuclease [Planctomycetes bacterium]|nr:Uma2 family endonuclease [Planctomycetota bacterium]